MALIASVNAGLLQVLCFEEIEIAHHLQVFNEIPTPVYTVVGPRPRQLG